MMDVPMVSGSDKKLCESQVIYLLADPEFHWQIMGRNMELC